MIQLCVDWCDFSNKKHNFYFCVFFNSRNHIEIIENNTE